jgi:lipopolysaccharide transport protein LptA
MKFLATLYVLAIALLPIDAMSEAFTTGSSFGKDDPVFISADSLKLEMNSRIFTYEGNVEVVSGELVLYSSRLTGSYSEQNQIEEMIATGSVTIQNGPNTFATAEQAIFNQENQTVLLSKDPSITQEGNILSADTITLFLQEDRSEASGQVRVKMKEAERKSIN